MSSVESANMTTYEKKILSEEFNVRNSADKDLGKKRAQMKKQQVNIKLTVLFPDRLQGKIEEPRHF